MHNDDTDEVRYGVVDWYREIGEIIPCIGGKALPGQLVRGLERLVRFELAAIFFYRGRSHAPPRPRPLLIHDNFEPATAKQGLTAYVEGTYILNPFYQAYINGLEPGVYRLRDLAPDAFFRSEYYRSFRVLPRPSEEIGYVTENWPEGMEEIAIAASLDGDMLAEVGLARASCDHFTDAELARLSAVMPVVSALLRRLWSEFHDRESTPWPSGGVVDHAFSCFGRAVLTERESEVTRLILRGHSSASIGASLGISLGTVKTHRKNAYAKLAISSQSELLSLFLQSLAQP